MLKATSGEAEVLRLRQSIQTQMRRRVLEGIELALASRFVFPSSGFLPASRNSLLPR